MNETRDRAREDSLGDRILLGGLPALLALAVSLTPIRSYDYWWHLQTGRLILSSHEVPRSDPYSFASGGTPWVDHEWLSQVLLYLAHTVLGPVWLVLLKASLCVGLAMLMTSRVRREGHGSAGMAILLATALLGASFRLDVRPELATLLLIPLIIELALRARDTGRIAPLMFVPPLAMIGANLHPGAVLIPALLLLGALTTWVADRLPFLSGAISGSRRPLVSRLLLVALASAIAVCANPYGYRVYLVALELRRLLESLPSPNLEWARPGLSDFPLFWLALGATLVVVGLGARSVDPIATPALMVSAVLAVAHLRNIGLFFVLLPLGLARPAHAVALACARLWRRTGSVQWKIRPGFVMSMVILLCAMPLPAILPPTVPWGLGTAAGNEPRAAVDFVEREGIGRHLYNDVRFGGYLIWRRFPEHQVFIDGRNEIYPDLLRRVFAAVSDSRAWEDMLARLDIDAAFLRYTPYLDRVVRKGRDGAPNRLEERAFSACHFPKETWALVYWDDDVMIVVRRSKENAQVIARQEYRAVHPEDWRHLYAAVVTGREALAPILDELRRKLREDPACARAQSLFETFGRLTQASGSHEGGTSAGR